MVVYRYQPVSRHRSATLQELSQYPYQLGETAWKTKVMVDALAFASVTATDESYLKEEQSKRRQGRAQKTYCTDTIKEPNQNY